MSFHRGRTMKKNRARGRHKQKVENFSTGRPRTEARYQWPEKLWPAISVEPYSKDNKAARNSHCSPLLPQFFLGLAFNRRRCRILALDPIPRPARVIGRAEPLRYDAF